MNGRVFNSVALITAQTDKIDGAATDGLLGVTDSLAYRVHEIERHLHSCGRFYERATTPNAEIHVADPIGSGAGAFMIDAGVDDWGEWVQVLGSGDTPAIPGNVEFDLHYLQVESTEKNATYFIQVAVGTSAAAAIIAEKYTDLPPFIPTSNQIDSGPAIVQMGRAAVGTKAWARCKSPGESTAQIYFYIGIHGYEG